MRNIRNLQLQSALLFAVNADGTYSYHFGLPSHMYTCRKMTPNHVVVYLKQWKFQKAEPPSYLFSTFPSSLFIFQPTATRNDQHIFIIVREINPYRVPWRCTKPYCRTFSLLLLSAPGSWKNEDRDECITWIRVALRIKNRDFQPTGWEFYPVPFYAPPVRPSVCALDLLCSRQEA